jgi:thiol:disulfide interchange protein DsbA
MTEKMIRLVAVFSAALMMAGGNLFAQGEGLVPYQEGLHYIEIEQAPAFTGETVEVEEFFSYLCTHCNTFEPYIESWKKRLPDYVEFTQIPVVFGRKSWELYARGFITAELMGVPEAAHTAMMDRLWKEKKIMRNMDEIADFYAQFGADKQKFISTAQSFAVDGRLRKDEAKVRAYGITGTPALVVNGRFRVSGNAAVPSFDAMLDVVDFLIELEASSVQQSSAETD